MWSPRLQVWSNLSFKCEHWVYSIKPYLSSHIYELLAHIEGLSRGYIPFPVSLLVLIKDDTLEKACIGDICQYIKSIIIIASNKEIIQPYTSLRTWPKALVSFQSFKKIPTIILCDAKSSYSILLGIPFIL